MDVLLRFQTKSGKLTQRLSYEKLYKMTAPFSNSVSCGQRQPTKRAPDAGDSAAISSSFLRLIIFQFGRLRRPRPSAGNANRWAVGHLLA